MQQLYLGNLSAMKPSHYGEFKDLRKEINYLDSAILLSFYISSTAVEESRRGTNRGQGGGAAVAERLEDVAVSWTHLGADLQRGKKKPLGISDKLEAAQRLVKTA
ncbi:hypothetical protein YC2023_016122 [Brassica napus]